MTESMAKVVGRKGKNTPGNKSCKSIFSEIKGKKVHTKAAQGKVSKKNHIVGLSKTYYV